MSIAGGPDIVENGLVLHLDAADLNSYPGSGTLWTDLSGNGNNGTFYNSPNISNKIITLSSTNDYLEIPQILQPLTIDFWFNSPSSANAAIIYAGSDSFNSAVWQWSVFYYNNALLWRPNSGGGGSNITSFVSLNNWYHFVMTRGNTRTIYINGNQISSTAEAAITVTGNIIVGKAGSNYWNGSFSSLKLYNYQLSNSEILQNYNAIKGRYGL